jgi:acyl-CoA thioesterase-1
VAVLALLLAGCSAAGVRYAEGKREGPVVVLGDSLAAGYGVEKGQGFVDLLGKRTGIPLRNLSTTGITTADSVKRIKEEVLPLEPSIVILELGGNDALQRVDPATTRANLARMIEELQAEKIPVILLGVRGGLMSDDLAGVYQSLAEKYQTGYVPDILDGVFSHPELKIDSVHPNARGHAMLADRVEPELRRVWQAVGGS